MKRPININAGWEVRNARNICRWILIWKNVCENEIVGCVAGYSGGGSFQLEKFYVKFFQNEISILQIDNEEKISRVYSDFSTSVDERYVRICEECQDEVLSWHDITIWEESENLVLLDEKLEYLTKIDDMLIIKNSSLNFLSEVLTYVGINARPDE